VVHDSLLQPVDSCVGLESNRQKIEKIPNDKRKNVKMIKDKD